MHNQEYKNLAMLTKRGNFLNIVSTDEKIQQKNATKFFSAMDVYPTDEVPVIREYFQNI